MKPEGMSEKAWIELHEIWAELSIKYGAEILRKRNERPRKENSMGTTVRFDKDGNPDVKSVDLTHILKANHHQFAAILERVEAAKKSKGLAEANKKQPKSGEVALDNPFSAYPIYLTAKDIMDILQVSKSKAHDMMRLTDFPLIQIGRTKRVHRDKFFKWLLEKERTITLNFNKGE